jgi:hypothetical protein
MAKINEVGGEDVARSKREEQRERIENQLRNHLTLIVEELRAVPPTIAWELIERIAAEEQKR